MNISFKFDIGQQVKHATGVVGTVTHAVVNRERAPGYWIEYLDTTSAVRELYSPEAQLS